MKLVICIICEYVCTLLLRLRINNYDVKVNIFDMAGQPFFYEVSNPTSRLID